MILKNFFNFDVFKSIFTNYPDIKHLWKFSNSLKTETEMRNW